MFDGRRYKSAKDFARKMLTFSQTVLILSTLILQAGASIRIPIKMSGKFLENLPSRERVVQASKSLARTVSENWVAWSPSLRSKIPRPQRRLPPGMQPHYLIHPFLWRPLFELEIAGGDVVVCHLIGEGRWRRTHWFLAVNGYELLHAHPRPYENHIAEIRADRRMYVPDSRTLQKTIDFASCKNIGSGGYNRARMIERAMERNVREVFYDEETCSSYHWVVYWVTGRVPRPWLHVPGFRKHMHVNCRLRTIQERPQPGDDDWLYDDPREALGPIPPELLQEDEFGSSDEEDEGHEEYRPDHDSQNDLA